MIMGKNREVKRTEILQTVEGHTNAQKQIDN